MALTTEQIKAVEAQWRTRAKSQGYKYGSKTYTRAECEFFVGAMVSFKVLGYKNWGWPYWCICLMSGRNIASKDGPLAPEDDTNVKLPTTAEGTPA